MICEGGEGWALVRSHTERRWLFEEPTQSRISPSILEYTKINLKPRPDSGGGLLKYSEITKERQAKRGGFGQWGIRQRAQGRIESPVAGP